MLAIESGNAWESSARRPDGTPNGWFFGSSRFIKDSLLRQSDDVEIKWSKHPAGTDEGVKPCSPHLGISILVRGKFSIKFQAEENGPWEEHWMLQEGDFIVSRGGCQHISIAHEDSTIVTVRPTTRLNH